MDIGAQTLSSLVIFSKYSKYIPELKRRETWEELCDRYHQMMARKYPQLKSEISNNMKLVRSFRVLPSMRALQFAGPAIEKNESRIFNCCFLPVESTKAFSEAMFLLLGGTGVGYSVQFKHIEKLPDIRKPGKERKFLIGDSIEGWADSVKVLIEAYTEGKYLPRFDFSDIRQKGTRLVTAGGKAPGPEPLRTCLNKVKEILDSKEVGSKLTSLECHDILCHIANAVLAGGIRRAAMICLFSFDDNELRRCKSNFKVHTWSYKTIDRRIPGTEVEEKVHSCHVDDKTGKSYYDLNVTVEQPGYGVVQVTAYWVSEEDLDLITTKAEIPWYYIQEQRGRANNSAVILRSRIKKKDFFELWKQVKESGCGEPGIFFTNNSEYGTNPCGEIALRANQFCNLTEVNVSDVKSQEDLEKRVKSAAFFGTLQAGFTDFHYLRSIWKKTTEKEALLGIGMTGIASKTVLSLNLEAASEVAVEENKRVSELIGINQAARICCIKPSGTTSSVLGTSSGIHGWHDNFYLRTIRFGLSEDISKYLLENHPEICEPDQLRPEDTLCVRIPIKAPDGAILRDEGALSLLERIKKFNLEWIRPGHNLGDNTHNVSATISVKEDEWQEVGQWMWENKDFYTGLSILPYDGGTYIQAPFESISKDVYEQKIKSLRKIKLEEITEEDDTTNHKQEAACGGGSCEI